MEITISIMSGYGEGVVSVRRVWIDIATKIMGRRATS